MAGSTIDILTVGQSGLLKGENLVIGISINIINICREGDVNKTCVFGITDRCVRTSQGMHGESCPTDVNHLGVRFSDNWGYCGEGCPRGENSTWGSDETLRVTTEFKQIKQTSVSDPDIYPALVGLGIMASSLLYIALVVKCFGIIKSNVILFIYKYLIVDKKISRFMKKIQSFGNIFDFDAYVIKCFGISLHKKTK